MSNSQLRKNVTNEAKAAKRREELLVAIKQGGKNLSRAAE